MQQATRPPETAAVRDGDNLALDQLHAAACRYDGPHAGPLAAAGHVYTTPAEPGEPLGWAVVACARHRRAA
jgi:hypothetical protein